MLIWVAILCVLCVGLADAGYIDADQVYYADDVLTVNGTTSLAPGNEILVEVLPLSFAPTNKSAPSGGAGVSGIVQVREGTPVNRWSFSFDSSTLPPDIYLIRVEALESGATDTATFIIADRPDEPENTTPGAIPTMTPIRTHTEPPLTAPSPATGFNGLIFVTTATGIAYLLYMAGKRSG
jgi:hypothetical protein